jgi:hypothetical protein
VWQQRERRREARDGLEKTMRSYNNLEVRASAYLIEAVKMAATNADSELWTTVRDIAAEIVKDLELVALSSREHD